MNAAEVKDALRRRHPAVDPLGGPGAWTCVEEWMNIDLLAVSAWASVRPFPRYARVGYEVKVSRSDYRRELANPSKRRAAVAFCHEFYLAVPAGLLTPYEETWEPPDGLDLEHAPLERPACLGFGGWRCDDGRLRCPRYRRPADRHGAAGADDRERTRRAGGTCPVCLGAGSIVESPVVRAGAPTLWIPRDVGLVAVRDNGRVETIRKAPRRTPAMRASSVALAGPLVQGRRRDGVEMTDAQLADLVRWVSFRPDPRHVEARAAK